MDRYKIYGDSYELMESVSVAIDGFAYKGELLDEVPKGKNVGYVEMADGSIIECYKSFNPMVIILPVLLVALAGLGVFLYFIYGQPKDVVSTSGAEIKTGTDNNVVSYNGFSAVRENNLEIDFQNGDYPATIQISGEGINSQVITVAPGEYLETIPVTFEATEGLVNAYITINTETSSMINEIVVEAPVNNTEDSPEQGLEGNWRGEYIYGVQ